jgi:hypothetical protein
MELLDYPMHLNELLGKALKACKQPHAYYKKPALGGASVDSDALRVAVYFPDGLGDTAISMAWLEALYKSVETRLVIDIYSRLTNIEPLAYNKRYIHALLPLELYHDRSSYALCLQASTHIAIKKMNEALIAEKAPNLLEILQKYKLFEKKFSFFLKPGKGQHFFKNGWEDFCLLQKWNRWDRMGRASGAFPFDINTRTSLHFDEDSMDVLEKLGLKDQPYLTLHAGADASYKDATKHPKVWPGRSWTELCGLLKTNFPDLKLVQLGPDNTSPFDGPDICMLGKTSLKEAIFLIKHALMHFDGDCGFVHLRHVMRSKSVVLFGPTSAEFIGYPGNINIASDFCRPCYYINLKWIEGCPRGYRPAECMKRISAQQVFDGAYDFLAGQPKEYLLRIDSEAALDPIGAFEIGAIQNACGLKDSKADYYYGPARSHLQKADLNKCGYVLNFLRGFQQGPLRIARVNAGRSAFSWYLSQLGHKVTVYDPHFLESPGGEPDIDRRFIQWAWQNGFEADFASIFNIQADDQTFNLVWGEIKSTIPNNIYYAIKEMLRILKAPGRFILTFDQPVHITGFQFIEETLASLGVIGLGAGYEHFATRMQMTGGILVIIKEAAENFNRKL